MTDARHSSNRNNPNNTDSKHRHSVSSHSNFSSNKCRRTTVISNHNRRSSYKTQPLQGQDYYIVGKILAEKTENGSTFFKVRWKDYSPSYDSWEPEENLEAVSDMIEEFRQSRRAKTFSDIKSRKRSSNQKWDLVPANQLEASKTKFYNDLQAGKIDIRSNDLYSRVKCRRRLLDGETSDDNNSEDLDYLPNSEPNSRSASRPISPDKLDMLQTSSSFSEDVPLQSTPSFHRTRPRSRFKPNSPTREESQHKSNTFEESASTNAPVSTESSSVTSFPSPESENNMQMNHHHHSLLSGLLSSHQSPPRPCPETKPISLVSNQIELLNAYVLSRPSHLEDLPRIPSPSVPPLHGRNLLVAAERGDWFALQRSAAVVQSLGQSDQERLLLAAVSSGQSQIVDYLISLCPGVSVECSRTEDGASALALAVEANSALILHRLLSLGANPDALDSNGDSALQRAVRLRRAHLVDLLCAYGGVNFSLAQCEKQLPLRYARLWCPQSAHVLCSYMRGVSERLHDHAVDCLHRLNMLGRHLLLAPHFIRPSPGCNYTATFSLLDQEAALDSSGNFLLLLIHSRQFVSSVFNRQLSASASVSLNCWTADGPCSVNKVTLNGLEQSALTSDGSHFITTLSSPRKGPNHLTITFTDTADSSIRVGLFALKVEKESVMSPATVSSTEVTMDM